ncbi:MAG: glycoside hydrolase family 2 protein, partial [Chloroflexota bacterium]|nr:glycoside hydrolase family 2 protein [Chloroflexota bacterium]
MSIKADRFAWGVWIEHGSEVRVDDNFFDLLPGQAHEVTLRGPKGVAEEIGVRTILGCCLCC